MHDHHILQNPIFKHLDDALGTHKGKKTKNTNNKDLFTITQ